MICIPISAASNREMLSLIRQAALEPADCYELRLDNLEEPALVEELVAACYRPVMATCRSVEEGGGYRGGFANRRDILRRAILAGVEYIDCEASDMTSLRGIGKSKLVISMHDFNGTPADLEYRVSALSATQADWVKFAVTAHSQTDNLKVFDVASRCHKPVICIAMGEMGLISRVLGRRYGSRLTFASLDAGRESAPGQITARELSRLYRYDRIDATTRLFGVLDAPGASRHEVLAMNLAFINVGQNAVCVPLAATDGTEFLATMPAALGLQGLRVGDVHQKAALEWADEATPRATSAGAASVLVQQDGRWIADYDQTASGEGCSPFLPFSMGMATSA